MPGISNCPHCQASVLIQSLDDPARRLRCPHCATHFAIGDVLGAVVEAPPLAQPVDEPEEAGAIGSSNGAVGGVAAGGPTFETQSLRMVSLEVSYIKREASHGRLADRPRTSREEPAEGGYAISSSQTAAADTGHSDELTAWAAMGQADMASGHSAAKFRSRQPKIGFLGHLIGVVLGGVVGLGLGYWILLWIGGREADFLKIWDRMPRWSVPRDKNI